jgi:Fe-S-cluster containining protein
MESLKFSKDAVIIFAEEVKKIGQELAKSVEPYSISRTVTDFYNRLSVLFEEQQTKNNIPIVCQAGCSFCCRNNRVEVFYPEVLTIAGFLNSSLDESRLTKIKNKLRQTVQKREGSSGRLHHPVYHQCALLEDNRCSIYEMRLANCRQFHSLNVQWCENKYINPAADIPDLADPVLKQKLHAAIAAFEEAFKQAGIEMVRYELNQVLYLLLDDLEIRGNWFKDSKE